MSVQNVLYMFVAYLPHPSSPSFVPHLQKNTPWVNTIKFRKGAVSKNEREGNRGRDKNRSVKKEESKEGEREREGYMKGKKKRGRERKK